MVLNPIFLGGFWFIMHQYSVFHTFIWRGWVGGLNQMKLTSFEKTVTFWNDPLLRVFTIPNFCLIFCVLSANSLLRVFTIPNFCLIFCVLSANSLLRVFTIPNFCLIFCVLSVNSLLRVFTIPNFCLIFCVLSANSLFPAAINAFSVFSDSMLSVIWVMTPSCVICNCWWWPSISCWLSYNFLMVSVAMECKASWLCCQYR